MTDSPTLEVRDLRVAYQDRDIIRDVDLHLPEGAVTAIVGPNGCGKSTLLRAMARLLKPRHGSVLLDGKSIREMATREVARDIGLLPQSPTAPDGITVADLVQRGRAPYHGLLSSWTSNDDRAVAHALEATGLVSFAEREVDTLSGGQRQRCWIAMALAQETSILLLDEPTTYLDVVHQLDILDMLHEMNRRHGTTIALVLHDLNLAARYADHMIAVSRGRIVTAGTADHVLTPDNLREVFDLEAKVISDPVSGRPLVVPVRRHERS